MQRRELMMFGVAATALTQASAATDGAQDHSHMNHGQMNHGAARFGALAAAAADCDARGEACLQHCLQMLMNGDTAMAGCAASVRQMLAACRAIHALALQQSTFVTRMAPVVRDICRACELECEKHAATHDVCRDCRDACVRCARECSEAAAG